jgi:large subunit ribosomal protein L10
MRVEKKQMVENIRKTILDSKYVFFVSYKGLTVSDFSELRNELAKLSSECHVLKNRLVTKAAELNGIKALSGFRLKGDTAVITGNGDAGLVAKALVAFGKSKEKLASKCAYFDKSLLNSDEIKALSSLPSKEVLRSQLLGVMQAPMANMAGVLCAKLRQIVDVVNNYKEKKEKAV